MTKNLEFNTGLHIHDLKRIQKVLLERDYRASIDDCEDLWDAYSGTVGQNWVDMSEMDDNDIFDSVSYYITN